MHYYYDRGVPKNPDEDGVVEIPVFAHVRSEFLNNSISPFLDFRIGYTVYDATGFYMTPSAGCRFSVGGRGGISVGLGYTMQQTDYEGRQGSHSVNCGGFSIKVGFDF